MSKLTTIKPFSDFITLLPGCKGLSIAENTPFEACQEALNTYGSIVTDGLWLIGDVLNFAKNTYGEEYAQLLDQFKYSLSTASLSMWVCEAFPPSRRHAMLTFNHHKGASNIKDLDAREKLLQEAEINKWSTREMAEVKKERFPKKAKAQKPSISKAPENEPEKPADAPLTQSDMLKALDTAARFWTELDPKTKLSPEFAAVTMERFNALRRNLWRFGLAGGNAKATR